MTNVAANAIVGKPKVSGGILCAPVGTALPEDDAAELDAAFHPVGYAGDDGFTRSEKITSDIKRAWGGDPIVVINSDTEYTAKFMMVEYLNPIVQGVLYGDSNVTTTAASSMHGNKLAVIGKTLADLPHKAWDIEVFSGIAHGRFCFPEGVISDRGDVVYKDDDLTAREITLTLFPDEDGGFFYEYWDDGRVTVGS